MRGLLHPRIVVVTGAGSGIGRATAIAFADADAEVVAADINEVTARETVDLVRHRGGSAHAYALDVTDARAWDTFAAEVHATHGVADVVVNNAGIAVAGSFFEQTAEDWERQLAVNFTGVVHGCRVFGAQMIERGEGGHIVNIASVAAFAPFAAAPSYCVSKAGVKMLSESLRAELAGEGIGVTAICPGLIATNIGVAATSRGLRPGNEDRFHALAAKVGPPIAADPSQVARAVVRAVRHNWAVVPVRPEAWLIYGLSRVSPRLFRTLAPYTGPQTLERVVDLLPQTIVDRLVA